MKIGSKATARCQLLWLASLLLALPLAAHSTQSADSGALLRQARDAHRQGNWSRSIPMLQKLLQTSPQNAGVNLLLGEDLLHSGRAREALAPLQTAARLETRDAAAEVILADAAATAGEYPLAVGALNEALLRSNGAPAYQMAWASFCLERYRRLGVELRATRRGEAAALRAEAAAHPEGSEMRVSLLAESAAEDSKQHGIWGELSLAQLAAGKPQDAGQSLEKARELERDENGTLQMEALLAAASGHPDAAQTLLIELGRRSHAEFQNALELFHHLLKSQLALPEPLAGCVQSPRAACPFEPTSHAVHSELSPQQAFAQGRWERLSDRPEPAADAHAEWLWRGIALARTGRMRPALLALERGRDADPDEAGFWLEVGYAAEAERAAASLRTSTDRSAYYELQGDVLARLQGHPQDAIVFYEQALKANPRRASLLERLAEAHLAIGHNEQAAAFAEQAWKADPASSEPLRTLSAIWMRQRDYAQALIWLERLVAVVPADPSARIQLAQALAETGDLQRALDQLAPALAAGYPDQKGALHALEARILRKLGREDEANLAAAEARRLSDAFQQRDGSDGVANHDNR